MRPISHLALTAIAFFIMDIFIDISLTVLFLALFLTVIVDVIDHSLLILFIKSDITDSVRKYAYKLKLKKAYIKYSKERWTIGKAFLHNLAFFTIITVVGIIYRSPVILLGISFHLICDMSSDLYFMKRLNYNWTFAFLFRDKKRKR